MNALTTVKIDQLPDIAVERIVEFVGSPFSVMVLSESTSALVIGLFQGRTRATRMRQLGCILRPVVRESMAAQGKSVVPAMSEDNLLALKISMVEISGGLECLYEGRGEFFTRVLVRSIEAYVEYFPRKQPDDPDRIEEWIRGLRTSMQLREEMRLGEEELEQYSSIFERASSSIPSRIALLLARYGYFPERMEGWRARLFNRSIANNVLHEVNIRDCYVISSMIRWIDCLRDSPRKVALIMRLAECMTSRRLPDIIRAQCCLNATRCIREIRDLSDQEMETERLALETVRIDSQRLLALRLRRRIILHRFIIISLSIWQVTSLVRLSWLGFERADDPGRDQLLLSYLTCTISRWILLSPDRVWA